LNKLDKNWGVFVSNDGGNTWVRVLLGHYSFNIIDHGSIIVALSKNEYSDDIFYSLDYG